MLQITPQMKILVSLLDLEWTGPSENLSRGFVAVANDQALPLLVTAIIVLKEELTNLRFDGLLQHPLGSHSDNLVQRGAFLELRSKGDHFRIDLDLWNRYSSCRNLTYGVSSVALVGPLMKQIANIHQQDTTPFHFLTEHSFRLYLRG